MPSETPTSPDRQIPAKDTLSDYGQTISEERWQAMGAELFGPDQFLWCFKCPICGHVASVRDYKVHGAPQGAVGFSCIGRWSEDPSKVRRAFGDNKGRSKDGPCDYTGGGLIGLNPVRVVDERGQLIQAMFEFAEKPR